MKTGDRIKDVLTGSEWTIKKIWATDPGSRWRWHSLVSDKGAHRRITSSELEERYERVNR